MQDAIWHTQNVFASESTLSMRRSARRRASQVKVTGSNLFGKLVSGVVSYTGSKSKG